MNYFVAALPRSRTAWLAAFLSQSGHFCFHDGFNGCSSMQEYRDKIGDCGDSSTGLQQYNINALYPNAPVVIIDKNETEYAECIQWANETFGIDYADEMKRQHDLLAKLEGLHIQQSEINDNLQAIFEHLTNSPWHDYYAELIDVTIQVSNPWNLDFEAANNLYNEQEELRCLGS